MRKAHSDAHIRKYSVYTSFHCKNNVNVNEIIRVNGDLVKISNVLVNAKTLENLQSKS